jgi:cell division protein FtsN
VKAGVAARRPVRLRHEVRFGQREAVAIGAVACALAAGIFGAGVVVGRGLSRGDPALARLDDRAAEAGHPDDPSPGADAAGKGAAAPAEEKLTFYKTLTAPTTSDLPPVGPPRIEERLVPTDEPAARPGAHPAPAPAEEQRAAAAPEPPAAAAERPAAPERPAGAAERPASPRREASRVERAERAPARPSRAAVPAPPAPPPPPVRPAPGPVARAPGPAAAPDAWTVQVSSFRSRTLADELRVRLLARGFDAYVLASATEGGPRYRVRVGAYANRSEAERVAAELRTERGLNPLVTSRAR